MLNDFNSLHFEELKEFLDTKVEQYNTLKFIESDPISIPHQFTLKEDIEISGFLTATIAWGNRKMIIKNATALMNLMGNTPYDFVINHTESDLNKCSNFVHRTFNGLDLIYFIKSLQHIYKNHQGLENVFSLHVSENSVLPAITEVKKLFFSLNHLQRTEKHFSDPSKGSAAKRINMFLRWMVRKDLKGVDFGIWNKIQPSQLSIPLDVHTGNIARKLGILLRKQNDRKALDELDSFIRRLDKFDPVKYDYALFGLGVFEKF